MPPKKVQRKSMPARIDATFTPSRRSPRIPTSSKAINESDYPAKDIDFSTDPSSENLVTFRYYRPKTPTADSPPKNVSPEVPTTVRRNFQARPSRLSNVYTPVVETPTSSSQGSRRTRRTAALETPQNQLSDPEDPESIGSTGWTYDQYMGGQDESMDPTSPSAASSKGTRASARFRKPTSRAIEALALKKKPRKKATPTSAKTETNGSAKGPKATVKSGKGKGKKPLQEKKAPLCRIDIDTETAGRKLYEITLVALGADFKLPSDPEWELTNARFCYFQAKEGLQRTREASAGDENQPNLYDSETDSGSIRQYKIQAKPQVDETGWARVGRVNDHGEEIIFPPSGHNPYWPPHTYNDETLPYPPVRSRSEKETQNDVSFGFPPLMGDRNIPFDAHSNFEPEDVSEEMVRAQARGEARQKALPAPSEPRKPRAAKQRQAQPSAVGGSASPAEPEEPKPKRRAARASLPAPTTRKAVVTKKPLARSAKAASKTIPALTPAKTENGKDESDPPFRPIRLVLTAPRPEGKTNGTNEDTEDAPKVKKQVVSPTSVKGKKRAADTMDGEEETAAGKRARLVGADAESGIKGRKRAATTTTPKSAPVSKAKDQIEESPRRKETPSRGRTRGRGGRGRGRG